MKKIIKSINKKIESIDHEIYRIKKYIYLKNTRLTYIKDIIKINHAGEISAQFLYYGQSFFIKQKFIKFFLLKSGKEEKKHLFWCLFYLNKYDSKKSSLYHVWKYGSFFIGNFPSIFNYKYNLGFLVETEFQVLQHLKHQIQGLSKSDYSLFFILKKMLRDEVKHANNAILLKHEEIPYFTKYMMLIFSFFMVNTAPYI